MPRRRLGRRQGTGLPPLPVHRRIEVGPDGFDYEVRPIASGASYQELPVPGLRSRDPFRHSACGGVAQSTTGRPGRKTGDTGTRRAGPTGRRGVRPANGPSARAVSILSEAEQLVDELAAE